MIGLIIPPAQIKKMLEKTAAHVAQNGSDFEKILMEREQHKPQFAFLKGDSPYRPYYDHRVAQISKQMLQGMQPQQSKQQPQVEQPKIKQEQPQQAAFIQKIFQQLKEPQPDQYTAEIPQKLTQGQQAIIQHTAQFSAKNGKNFLVALSQRQKNNPQFEFLRGTSKHHPYFLKLVEAYTNLLQLNDNDMDRLKKYSQGLTILDKCRQVFDYYMAKQQQARGKKQQTKQVKESNIDWNDFELVQTINFDTETSKNIAGGQLVAHIQKNVSMIPKTMEEKIISEPKKRQILQQCHVCRQSILASEMNKHLKTCLGQKKKTNTVDSQMGDQVDIRRNLQDLSIKRPDIFGTQDNQIRAQRTQNDDKPDDKMVFDGQSNGINRSSGSLAMMLFQQKKLKEEFEKKNK